MNSALLAAMIAVESGGNPSAIGDGGRSVGILQISRAVVADVNRIHGTDYRWPDDCFTSCSFIIWHRYLSHYAPGASDETVARIRNGGPSGHRKASTKAYWRKVRSQL